jgi:restriction system protein
MAVWLVRAGGHGEFEQKFVAESRVYVTWDDLAVDLSKLPDREALRADMASRYPEQKPKAILNWASQVWPFCREMKKGDLVVLPLKSQPAIQIGEIDGDYHFEPKGPNPFFHWRPVKWVGEAIPRSRFGQDLRYRCARRARRNTPASCFAPDPAIPLAVPLDKAPRDPSRWALTAQPGIATTAP